MARFFSHPASVDPSPNPAFKAGQSKNPADRPGWSESGTTTGRRPNNLWPASPNDAAAQRQVLYRQPAAPTARFRNASRVVGDDKGWKTGQGSAKLSPSQGRRG